jgi:hypothetical protein
MVNARIHGAGAGICGMHGGPPSGGGILYREHDHATGEARGLACFRCNKVILGGRTLPELRLAVAYLERVELYYAERGA